MRRKQQGLGTQLALKRVQDEAWGLQRNTAEQCAVALSAEDHRRRSLTTIELKENVAYAARNPRSVSQSKGAPRMRFDSQLAE